MPVFEGVDCVTYQMLFASWNIYSKLIKMVLLLLLILLLLLLF